MSASSSPSSRLLVCLVTLLVCGAGTIGVVAATDGSALVGTEEDSLEETVDETTDELENTTNETTDELDETTNETTDSSDDLENTTDETTDEVDETTDETTDGVEETIDETADGIDDGVDETTDEVDETVAGTTDTLENATNEKTELEETVDETIDELDETVDETTDAVDGAADGTSETLAGTVDLEVSATVSTESNDGETDGDGEPDSEGADASDSNDESGVVPAVPDGTSSTADAVLVGLLGAITATGAAAGSSAAGGAAGASAGASASASAGAGGAAGSAGAGSAAGGAAAGGATGLTASWLSQSAILRHLRRLGSLLPWELASILGYSRYDDSDPLENDRRRTIYETIADDPGCYLSQVSEESDVALSTVRHHVRILEEEGLISATKVNGKRRYYLEDDARTATGGDENGDGDGTGPTLEDAELHAALAEPSKRAVLEALAELDAAPNGRLAEELDRDPSTVSHHLSALEENGLVVREKEGRSVVNELAPDVEAALRDAGAFEEAETEAADQTVSAPADD